MLNKFGIKLNGRLIGKVGEIGKFKIFLYKVLRKK